MVFHGDGRPKLHENVIEHDLVLTTYATLVADCKGSKVLQKVEWFRVVLDEGNATIILRFDGANCGTSSLDTKSKLATISSFRKTTRATQMVSDGYTDSEPAK
jgi:SNF2 family DNA or RNA helicase